MGDPFDCFLHGHLGEACDLERAPLGRWCAWCGSRWSTPWLADELADQQTERLVQGDEEADESHRGRLSARELFDAAMAAPPWIAGWLGTLAKMEAVREQGGDPYLRMVYPRRGGTRLVVLDRREGLECPCGQPIVSVTPGEWFTATCAAGHKVPGGHR